MLNWSDDRDRFTFVSNGEGYIGLLDFQQELLQRFGKIASGDSHWLNSYPYEIHFTRVLSDRSQFPAWKRDRYSCKMGSVCANRTSIQQRKNSI